MRPSLLDVSAQEGARLLALGFLDQATGAAARLDDPADAEALHDFRVALRRLRSCIRAYDALLGGSVGRRQRRRLGRIAAGTGPGRDAEVQLAWIPKLAPDPTELHLPGLSWLSAGLEAQKLATYARVREGLRPRFTKVAEALRERLGSFTMTIHVGGRSSLPRLAEVAAEAARTQRAALAEEMLALESAGEQDRAHRARIAGKRLRYLLEPFREELQESKEALRDLRRLQDQLGDLNDLHNLAATVGQALEDAALARARELRDAANVGAGVERALSGDERPGLLALLQRTHADRTALLAQITSEWLAGGALERALRAVDAAIERLAATNEPGLEIERKYLLRALPPLCEGRDAVEIDQGYLPGERLIERIRRKRTPEGETYVRTVKLGQGMVRIEVEEACSLEVFAKLWSLTEGRRVQKRRYAVEAGTLVWEIDAFSDRELFLAEVELPSEDTEVVIPQWLAPYLEREVTSEAAYVNSNLAC